MRNINEIELDVISDNNDNLALLELENIRNVLSQIKGVHHLDVTHFDGGLLGLMDIICLCHWGQ
ncbi:MAG: hypothetical protein AAF639_11365 [Chloroflexota bacterium]